MTEKLKFIFSELWEFLKPIIKILMSEAGKALAEAAQVAVKTVAENLSGKGNGEKQQTAFRLIESTLKQKGIELGASAINMAIELAVQKMKENSK